MHGDLINIHRLSPSKFNIMQKLHQVEAIKYLKEVLRVETGKGPPFSLNRRFLYISRCL